MLPDFFHNLWLQFAAGLLFTRLIVVPLSFTVHELAHALIATLFDDPTPREDGRLSLNPARHWEYIGLISGVLIGVGWSRPTPIRPHRMRGPGRFGGTLAVLAGPLASAGLAALGVWLLDLLALPPEIPWHAWPSPAGLLTVLARFNLMLALINVLPLYPLDGFALVRILLPGRAAAWWERFSGWTTALLGAALFVLLMAPPPIYAAITRPVVRWGMAAFLGW
jgi:Zn-dependent protease